MTTPSPDELAAARAAELVEVVDANGAVERIVTRAEMRRDRLRHRCTYVMVVNHKRELLVHQRAFWKGIYPGYWDIAFGGICGVGEPWELSAARELHEEAGISGVDLRLVGEVTYDGDDGHIIGRAYVATTDADPVCEDGEVIATDRVGVDDLDRWLEGRDVSIDSKVVLLPILAREFQLNKP